MLLITYSSISSSFMLIRSSIQEKQKKNFLICSNIHVDAINFEVCEFIKKHKNVNIFKNKYYINIKY